MQEGLSVLRINMVLVMGGIINNLWFAYTELLCKLQQSVQLICTDTKSSARHVFFGNVRLVLRICRHVFGISHLVLEV